MYVLLDTYVLLWWLADDKVLPKKAKDIIAEPSNVIFVSAVSAWEISIKQALGKLSVPENLEQVIIDNAFESLSIDVAHAIFSGQLPKYHADPFDRMLIAQSQLEKMRLLTHDQQLQRHDDSLLIV